MSTGVIGPRLPMDKIEAGIRAGRRGSRPKTAGQAAAAPS